MGILSSGLTDIGKKRKTNQDAIYLNQEANYFVLADGMGGHQGGDVASSTAVKCIPSFLAKYPDKGPVVSLRAAINHANSEIYNLSEKDDHLKGMGTTVVMLHFRDSSAYIGNVGDSRAYIITQRRIFQLSRDHSLIQEKMNMGAYTREQARHDKMKNVLVRSVGFEPRIEVDVFTYKVARNDIFFLCSDGLHGQVSDQNMMDIVNHFIPHPEKCTQDDVDNCVKALVKQANENGGLDNISVIMAIAQ